LQSGLKRCLNAVYGCGVFFIFQRFGDVPFLNIRTFVGMLLLQKSQVFTFAFAFAYRIIFPLPHINKEVFL